ncbi:alpha-mannosidase 2x isoform X2 [Folsomia candida]|uniref:alpha-mannosidase 2x isoform X2 n=1 Tax=Folsomia candida TaxID=158441 RepID=UPI001604D782|nr:alpha-mannosidase 2x isoform X2 [Folsomia candida]
MVVYNIITYSIIIFSIQRLFFNRARTNQKIKFLNLIKEGRLEILTGAFVMPDEATTSLYTLVDEIITGRQWVSNFLGVTPNISWAIDPFGHGPTMPYLMKLAGVDKLVVQRTHFGWKKYLGAKRYGNFNWVPRWDTNADYKMLTHHAPYDIYTTKHTCGPNPLVCLRLDFRSVIGEYSEYSRHARPVRDIDLDELAADMVGQFQRTASLFSPSRVVMFELGEDFRFGISEEWDQQYENHVPLMNHINANRDRFGVDIRFGTVSDYFNAVELENHKLATFSGDFFPYSDVYLFGRPAYWTGYFGTRPYWKKFYQETLSLMRDAEILYTYAGNLAARDPDHVMSVVLRREYRNFVEARKMTALFATHDGVTGTSRRVTMEDFGQKLMEARKTALQIQRQSIRTIFYNGLNATISSLGLDTQTLSFGELPTRVPRVIYESDTITKKILVFNSLSFNRTELIRVLVTSPTVKVVGTRNENIHSQINPYADLDQEEIVFGKVFELSFLAELEPMTLHSFEIRRTTYDDPLAAKTAKVSCRGCKTLDTQYEGTFSHFEVENITSPTIILGNKEQELYFNGTTGFLRRVIKLQEEISIPVKVQFGAYRSVYRDSGAYLLKPDVESHIQIPFDDQVPAKLLIVEGPVTSYLASYDSPLVVTTRLLGSRGQGIQVENQIDLGNVPAEVYMRIDTWLNSTTLSVHKQNQPTIFTDQNGYTMEKRVKVPWIGYEGNVYPVTSMVYMQDTENLVRFSVMVDRAHGFNSMNPGRLEALIERRTIYDDGKGMAEGVTDNRKTISNYIFHIERLGPSSDSSPEPRTDPKDNSDYRNNLPTLQAQKLSLGLNHVPTTFGYDDTLGGFLGRYSLLTKPLPEDSHVLTLRTLSNFSILPDETEMPSEKALLVTQKLGYLPFDANTTSCTRNNYSVFSNARDLFEQGTKFVNLDIDSADITDLAGVVGVQYSGKRSFLPIVERKPFEIATLLVTFRQKKATNSNKRGSSHAYHHQYGREIPQTLSLIQETTTLESVSYEKAR